MSESRHDRVWREWKAMADGAGQPAFAPRGIQRRGGFPIGLVSAAVVAVLIVVIAARYWTPQVGGVPGASGSSRPATPTEVATATTAPSAASTPTPSAVPAATSILSGTPRPGDEAMAVSIATKYQTYIKGGNYAAAWAMIAPQWKSGTGDGGYAQWAANWADIAKSQGAIDFELQTPSRDWQQWDPNWPAPLPSILPGDYGRAFVIVVDYPWTSQTNDWDVLLILPTTTGDAWEVYILR